MVVLFGTNLFQIYNCFLSELFLILLTIFGCVWRIHLSKIRDKSTVWIKFLCSAAEYILPSIWQWKIYVPQKIVSLLRYLVHPRRKNQNIITIRSKLESVNQNLTKFTFFSNTPSQLTMFCKKKIEKLEFVKHVNFECIDSFKNKGTKYLLTFDDSFEKIINSKTFDDIGTARSHHGLSTIYNKYNLFYQSKIGRDVELNDAHTVLLKPPRDVMQVSTIGAELGLGSELFDWCWNAASVPYGHLLIDLSPQTDDRLRSCINSGCIPSKPYILELLN